MMRKHDPAVAEGGFFWLEPLASEYVFELIAAFKASEPGDKVRYWLLELIGKAKSEAAYELLAEQLGSEDESLRFWAVAGLQNLDSKAARRLLFEHGPFPQIS